MAAKSFHVDDIGMVHIYKRRGVKNLRLSIGADGKVRVTLPSWSSYASGIAFVQSKSEWIQQNLPTKEGNLQPGQHIGKAHRLHFIATDDTAIRTRIAGSEIKIMYPKSSSVNDSDVQKAAHTAGIRALRTQAAKLLPVRLRQLAEKFGFEYSSVQIKQLKGRWGSCDTRRHITLNLFLMQLPWQLIDYVLIHELVHTKHLDHSAAFWSEFLLHEPQAKALRREIRTHKPILNTIEVAAAMA